MKAKTGFARKPDVRAVTSFIEGAGVQPGAEPPRAAETPATPVEKKTRLTKAAAHPWEGARGDVIKAHNLRLPETYLEMLRFISEHAPNTSMNSFCVEVLKPAIRKKVEEITGAKVAVP